MSGVLPLDSYPKGRKAIATFREYEQHHRAKADEPTRLERAARNASMADDLQCELIAAEREHDDTCRELQALRQAVADIARCALALLNEDRLTFFDCHTIDGDPASLTDDEALVVAGYDGAIEAIRAAKDQPPVARPCDCIATVNTMLAERNTVLHEPMFLTPNRPTRLFVETRQIETGRGKKKAASMFASCCPFCGVRYPEIPA